MVAAEACEREENSRSGTDVGAFLIFSWATGWDTSVATPKRDGRPNTKRPPGRGRRPHPGEL